MSINSDYIIAKQTRLLSSSLLSAGMVCSETTTNLVCSFERICSCTSCQYIVGLTVDGGAQNIFGLNYDCDRPPPFKSE